MRRALVAGLALLGVCGALPVAAYVRTRSSSTKATPSAWGGSCVFIQPDADGTPDLPNDTTFAVIQKSLDNWNNVASSCGYLKLMYDQPTSRDAHYDGFNMVKFRTDRWCHPNDATSKDVCYSAAAAAITSVFMVNDGGDKDGLILDADIELNDIDFTFAVIDTSPLPTPKPGTQIADLENTLTHELGHLQGLSHTCRDSASFPNDVDENGNPPPACNMLGSLSTAERIKITEATMYNFAAPAETKKRSPEADDQGGVCAAYPTGMAGNRACEHTNLAKATSGCGAVPGAPPGGLPLGVVALLLALAVAAQVASQARKRRPE